MLRGVSGSDVMRSHVSGGFTLDEAARLFRASSPGRLMACPSCGGLLHDVVGARPSGQVWLLQCSTCHRGLVFDRPGARAPI